MTSNSLVQDAAILLRDNEDEFLAKVKTIVMLGGIADNSRSQAQQQKGHRRRSSLGKALDVQMLNKTESEPPLMPDNSEVNQLDMKAAEFLYSRSQELGIQLIMVPQEVCRAISRQ